MKILSCITFLLVSAIFATPFRSIRRRVKIMFAKVGYNGLSEGALIDE